MSLVFAVGFLVLIGTLCWWLTGWLGDQNRPDDQAWPAVLGCAAYLLAVGVGLGALLWRWA